MGRLAGYARFLRHLVPFLNHPLSLEDAKAEVAERMQHREQALLCFLRKCIYENPTSPYLPLLRQAGCAYDDAVAGVRQWGVEGFLQRLLRAGVTVSFEAFKGRAPLIAGGVEHPVPDADFDNPSPPAGPRISSGGTSGRPSRTFLDLEFRGRLAVYERLMLAMLNIEDVPVAVWQPTLPAVSGMVNCLLYARSGHPPARWFHMLPASHVRLGLESRVATAVIVAMTRFSHAPIPWPRALPVDRPEVIVDWIRQTRRRAERCVVHTYVSQAVRVCQAAAAAGLRLEGTQFIVGAEPLTAAKRREIEACGADVYPRYFSTEAGAIGFGCGTPVAADDLHLLNDTVAVIQPDDPTVPDTDPRPLVLTSLLAESPKVLLNVQMGDAALMTERPCACLLGALGLQTHLSSVRSYSRATGEGMSMDAVELTRIIEEVLPARYGGASTDYQWVEEEDERALTRLCLRIDPRVGPVDEARVVEDILAQLRGGERAHRMYAEVWRQARTIRVLRERPLPTVQGKLLPVLRERRRAPSS